MTGVRILFVCLGNICRSPLAKGILAARSVEAGLQGLEIDSAGMVDWQVGRPPDRRARAAARRRGIVLKDRARRIAPRDFEHFDFIIAVDRSVLATLNEWAPPEYRPKLKLLGEFDATSAPALDVADPYYDEEGGFDATFEQIDRCCRGLVEFLRPLAGG